MMRQRRWMHKLVGAQLAFVGTLMMLPGLTGASTANAQTATPPRISCADGEQKWEASGAALLYRNQPGPIATGVTIAAGDRISITKTLSWDGYPSRAQVFQANEQWAVRIGSVYSSLTPDVADLVVYADTSAIAASGLGTIEAAAAGQLEVVHAGFPGLDRAPDPSPNSVHVSGFCYRVEPAATTTTTPVTTTPVTTTLVTTTPVTTTPVTTTPAPQNPCISLKKYARVAGTIDWFDAQDLDNAVRQPTGGSIEMQISITNCGDSDLIDLRVTDTGIAGCERVIASLPANSTRSSFVNFDTSVATGCSDVAPIVTRCNTASVTAQPVVGGSGVGGSGGVASGPRIGPASDPICYVALPVAAPCINLKKYVRPVGTTAWFDAQTEADAVVHDSGSAVEFQFVVSNCGNIDLTDVVVTDPVDACSRPIGSLPIGSTVTYSSLEAPGCGAVGVLNPTCFTASVVGQPVTNGRPDGPVVGPVSDPACFRTAAPTTTTTTITTTLVAVTTAAPTTAVVFLPPVDATTTTLAVTVPAQPTAAPTTTTAPAPSVAGAVAPAAAATTQATTTTPTVQVLGATIEESPEVPDLPFTGSETRPLTVIGAMLVMLGGITLVLGRRRSN
jgi:hypothetical protein